MIKWNELRNKILLELLFQLRTFTKTTKDYFNLDELINIFQKWKNAKKIEYDSVQNIIYIEYPNQKCEVRFSIVNNNSLIITVFKNDNELFVIKFNDLSQDFIFNVILSNGLLKIANSDKKIIYRQNMNTRTIVPEYLNNLMKENKGKHKYYSDRFDKTIDMKININYDKLRDLLIKILNDSKYNNNIFKNGIENIFSNKNNISYIIEKTNKDNLYFVKIFQKQENNTLFDYVQIIYDNLKRKLLLNDGYNAYISPFFAVLYINKNKSNLLNNKQFYSIFKDCRKNPIKFFTNKKESDLINKMNIYLKEHYNEYKNFLYNYLLNFVPNTYHQKLRKLFQNKNLIINVEKFDKYPEYIFIKFNDGNNYVKLMYLINNKLISSKGCDCKFNKDINLFLNDKYNENLDKEITKNIMKDFNKE